MKEKPAQKKRFIAGARCPSCSALDKIYVTEESNKALLICNACGYREYQENNNQEWKPIKLPDSGESSH
jgi:uncharacterized metal-binding protein (TIGR02443 family)